MQLTPNNRGMRLTREEIEQIAREVALHLTTGTQSMGPGIEAIRQPTGTHLRLNYADSFPAYISSGTNPYAWNELWPSTSGGWYIPPVARTGNIGSNPAYEINANKNVPSGTRVLMTRGFFNFSGAGQEYVFEYDASTTGGGSGTKSVPLQITSSTPSNGLYPANILLYNANTNTFSTGPACWAITTNENQLYPSDYTGIFLSTGGSPSRDIYCISDNLVVEDSSRLQRVTGVNQLLFDPRNLWTITPGALPGEAIVSLNLPPANNTLTVIDNQGGNTVTLVTTITLGPYYTWSITSTSPGTAVLNRLFEVWRTGTRIGVDVWKLVFTPDCVWDIQSTAPGVVSINRKLAVQTQTQGPVNDVAKITFAPPWTWNVVAGGSCEAVVSRLFEVYTTTPTGDVLVGADVYQLIFKPSCAWDIFNPNPGTIAIHRVLDFKFAGGAAIHDVATVTFAPGNCWEVIQDGTCGVIVERIFSVVGTVTVEDVYQINFSTNDFVVANAGAGVASVTTKGTTETKSISFCDGSGAAHQLVIVTQDGLIQSITVT